ncbi:PSD1 and planctomycete cytochrome C domain-containing protein [Paraglaciecola sp. L3A3]|uniref:PSD1 and planctomycete cytochrome C domain-containing protein n=1 Tax=Paraglaciecola sp. L3A3 TaxID=2686358 RepID=UPI00131D983A|nr:PSD1 and planctomycete cytochrome C domain-containing protein [Paraglaciecola sp. L3A3]
MMRLTLRHVQYFIGGLLLIVLSACDTQSSLETSSEIDFNRDIRPILNENCTGCHGGVSKQSGVSFIIREEALGRGHSGRLTVVPGDPDASGLIERIESKDPNIRMPYKAPPLPQEKISLLRQWIEEGAVWEEHWAFEKPKMPAVPKFEKSEVLQNEIDQFVQLKLSEHDLSPSLKADKATLLRRLSLDLTGLPPTLAELDAFILDSNPDAYDKQVDRLLASKHFGERWASMWLDIARYADSRGYTRDQYRAIWPYRDWVINAFNQNKSYKDFFIEQLAGDLLPNRTVENMIATGFHRNTPINNEGGTDDEEFRVVAMLDRVSTTWAALNGITMNCVQCHSHPYDPIQHDEFYKFYSFLNSTQDADKFTDTPLLKLANDPSQQQQTFELQEHTLQIKNQIAEQAVLANENEKWLKLPITKAEINEMSALEIKRKEHQDKLSTAQEKTWLYNSLQQKIARLDEHIARLQGQALVPLSLKQGEVYEPSEALPPLAVYQLDTELPSDFTPDEQKITAIRFMVSGLNPNKTPHTPEFSYNIDKVDAWHVAADGTETSVKFATFLASSTEVLDSQIKKLNTLHKNRKQATQALAQNDQMGTAISLFAQRLFNPRWSIGILDTPIKLAKGETIRVDVHRLQGIALNEQPSKLRQLKIEASSNDKWLALAKDQTRLNNIARYVQLNQELQKISGINMPVMYEQDAWDKRGTSVFARGNFLAKEDKLLVPDVPGILPDLPSDKPRNRLTMAEWFFDPEQPLTARVAVNRFWHALFGRGIVETLEDFGSIGEKPTHPKLLDWLALTFKNDMQWDIKALVRLIVSSATYQQQSNILPEQAEKDPDNIWLSRGPKQRLTAEMIRDQALFASGLLSNKMGGIGVMPPQPEKIWGRLGTTIKDWKNAEGEDKYRRAIYTFIKRQYIYPSFVTFDMESREISHARRIPTNTPLQALVTLNDPVYHDAAQSLAKLMIEEKTKYSASEQAADNAINLGFLRVMSRVAKQDELTTVKDTLDLVYASVGTEDELGAWTAVASIIFNLDSALTR